MSIDIFYPPYILVMYIKYITMKYTLLALLAGKPAHGYELKQTYERLFKVVSPRLNAGQIYTTLSRLERDELVQDHHVEQEDRPDKRVYQLTPAGREALEEWLRCSVTSTLLKDEFFLKLVLAREAGIARPGELINRQRRAYLQTLHDLNEAAARPEQKRDPIAGLLVRGAILHLKADLAWLELCEEEFE